MTQAIRTTSRVDAQGNVRLPPIPQAAGKTVDVIVLVETVAVEADAYPLRGTLVSFDDPFSPVATPEDWEPGP